MGAPSERALGHMLSFSSGVMLFISFSDLLVDSIAEVTSSQIIQLISQIGYFSANLWVPFLLFASNIQFFIGILFFAIVAYFVPEPDTEKWIKGQKSKSASGKVLEKDLLMAGIMTALGIR
jgi:ZIP family zinc transporter